MIHVTMPIFHGVSIGLFMGGGATALGVIVATVATEWQRICGLALGDVPATLPLLSKHFLQERPLARPLDRPAPRGPA
jgi:hypothetical protein